MTIAQQIKWDFKANGFLEIRDKNGKEIYFEDSNGQIKDNRPKPCENKIYTEKEVENLLMTQRENCYVSVLSVTNDKKLAELAIKSPEPCNWRNQIQSEIL